VAHVIVDGRRWYIKIYIGLLKTSTTLEFYKNLGCLAYMAFQLGVWW